MLRYLGDVNNVVKFQRLCGLKWNVTKSEKKTGSSEILTDEYCDQALDNNNEKNTKDYGNAKRNGYPMGTDSEPLKTAENNGWYKRYGRTADGTVYECNQFVHELFKFGSELGNEAFYLVFLPFVFWNIDDYTGRRLIMLWVFNMYAGHVIKDLLCWPRPPSPPVLRVESAYESEFGMPSTHAVGGFIIPFGLVYFTHDRFQYNLIFGILFCAGWTSLVCFSRIYRGMHTFQDIVAGLSVAAFVTALWLPYLDLSLELFLSSSNAWIIIFLVLMCMTYAFPTKCIETRDDTIRIISVGCGCMMAAWKDFYIDQVPLPEPYKGTPVPILASGIIPWVLFGASRFIIGISLIILLKITLKGLINSLTTFLKSIAKTTSGLANEILMLPYLLITYSAIGFTAVYVAPKVFENLGLIF